MMRLRARIYEDEDLCSGLGTRSFLGLFNAQKVQSLDFSFRKRVFVMRRCSCIKSRTSDYKTGMWGDVQYCLAKAFVERFNACF